jgi:hypothetical protein
MAQEVMLVSDTARFFLIKNIDVILSTKNLTRSQILDRISNLRDELDRYG